MAQDDPKLARQVLDVFARSERPTSVFTLRRTARLAARALMRRRGERASTMLSARRDLAGALDAWRERRLAL
jgi:hypothetical protein